MNAEQFETHTEEIVAAALGLLREFEGRIGEVLHVHRDAVSEARAEGVQVAQKLHELERLSRTLVEQQREVLARIEREWQLQISRRLGWRSDLKWVAGIALGIALTMMIGVHVLLPSAEGLSNEQSQAVMTRIAPCLVGKETHVCVWPDEPPARGAMANGQMGVIVKGM